jgi:hypothetical protein
MRILQVIAGITLIPVAAAITWAVSRSRAATLLCAFWSPEHLPGPLFAHRPAYAITTLLTVVVLACGNGASAAPGGSARRSAR